MIFLMAIVSAQPPFETNTAGLQVFYPQFEYVAQDTNFDLHLHVSNYSNGYPLTNDIVDCYVHLYNSTGSHTFESGILTKDANGWDHEIEIASGNFSDIGTHAFYIFCNNSISGGEARGTFIVTESGIEMDEGRSLLSIGILFILCIFIFISLYSLFSIEDYRGKFVLYWVSHLLVILTTFIAWQIGVEGLLGGLAITGIFKVLFWFFLIASFPMLILSLAWIFYIHTMNEHFEKLIDKGEDPETAFNLMKKKKNRRRW